LHGEHQGDNASVAISAVEAFFDSIIDPNILGEAMRNVVMPGRFEVLGHQPLVVLDGAHNPAGAKVCAEVFFEDFNVTGRKILVTGALRSRDPDDLLTTFRASEFDIVITCTPPSPRGLPATEMAEVARRVGCDEVIIAETVESACEIALKLAQPQDAVLISGSLYIVSAARPFLILKGAKLQ
jgi:dihydrofolate synthase / folylpolyglutamate synthase